MSTLKVNTVESATTPTVLISDGLSVSGVSTLTGGLKVGTAITMSSNGNFGITGIMTASTFVGGGMGKILQIVQANHNSALTNTDGNYQDTGLSASITTSSNHAGVLILANLAVGATANNGGDAYVKFKIVDVLEFYIALGNENVARSRISAVVNSRIRGVLGEEPLSAVLSESRCQRRYAVG